MKAIVQTRYGLRSLGIGDAPRPLPGDDQVLVRVHAASLNWAVMMKASGKPFAIRFMAGGLLRPRKWIPGSELAGRVEAVGGKVLAFKPGDEVYGDTCHCGYGALAEYACADSGALALKPANLSFEEAAAVPQSALVALQGLRAGGIRAGQRVLVHGASGGIGTFAVQIARSFGAEVTGVCGPGNLELVASLGADRVLDYTKGDFLKAGEAYDLILAVRGTRPVRDYYGALSPEGSYVMAGGTIGRFLLTGLQAPRLFRSGGRKLGSFTHAPNTEDLDFLKQLIEAGKVRPVIDRVYPLRDAGAAFRHLQDGHARGRVVIRI